MTDRVEINGLLQGIRTIKSKGFVFHKPLNLTVFDIAGLNATD